MNSRYRIIEGRFFEGRFIEGRFFGGRFFEGRFIEGRFFGEEATIARAMLDEEHEQYKSRTIRALIDKSLTEELIIRIYPYSSSLILLIDEFRYLMVYSAVGRTNPP